jgi:hypothetical protein
MKWVTDILKMTNVYRAMYAQDKSVEQIFVEFQEIEKIHEEFAEHIEDNQINFCGMKKSKAELARRKIFIKWYVAKHNEKSVDDCVNDLTTILFISESTVYQALYDYR